MVALALCDGRAFIGQPVVRDFALFILTAALLTQTISRDCKAFVLTLLTGIQF